MAIGFATACALALSVAILEINKSPSLPPTPPNKYITVQIDFIDSQLGITPKNPKQFNFAVPKPIKPPNVSDKFGEGNLAILYT